MRLLCSKHTAVYGPYGRSLQCCMQLKQMNKNSTRTPKINRERFLALAKPVFVTLRRAIKHPHPVTFLRA